MGKRGKKNEREALSRIQKSKPKDHGQGGQSHRVEVVRDTLNFCDIYKGLIVLLKW